MAALSRTSARPVGAGDEADWPVFSLYPGSTWRSPERERA